MRMVRKLLSGCQMRGFDGLYIVSQIFAQTTQLGRRAPFATTEFLLPQHGAPSSPISSNWPPAWRSHCAPAISTVVFLHQICRVKICQHPVTPPYTRCTLGGKRKSKEVDKANGCYIPRASLRLSSLGDTSGYALARPDRHVR